MVAVVMGGILMAASFTAGMGMYRFSSSGENQVLATNMAQQVIDNARNSRFTRLKALLNGGQTMTQALSLYTYPSNPAASCFPRPLLRNETMAYQAASDAKRFNGTVLETLTDLAPASLNNGLIRVDVAVTWADSTGSAHSYRTTTTISERGIHN
jgi:hypothetical protein